MQKIVPHLWFNTEAKQATALYVSLFKNSIVKNSTTISATPSGDYDIVSFALSGQDFMAISAGPYFKFNPSISFFTVFDNEHDIDSIWKKLIEGGTVLMPYQSYPWAYKYGWLQDRFGLSWQLSWSKNNSISKKITPLLMFTKENAGKTKQAIDFYTSIFPNSKIDMLVKYEKDDGDKEEFIKHARFTINGKNFMAMDSSLPHKFTFNEAVSFIVNCETQKEIDYYWKKLSAIPEAEQCGWLKDKFGVSWQIIPTVLKKLLSGDDKEKITRVTAAFLKMKKFNIAELQKAAENK